MTCHLSDRDHEDLDQAYADLADAMNRIKAVQDRHPMEATLPLIGAFGRARTELDMARLAIREGEHYLEPDAA